MSKAKNSKMQASRRKKAELLWKWKIKHPTGCL